MNDVVIQVLINGVKSAVTALARYFAAHGEDPQAALNAHLDFADIVADAVEKAKFPDA